MQVKHNVRAGADARSATGSGGALGGGSRSDQNLHGPASGSEPGSEATDGIMLPSWLFVAARGRSPAGGFRKGDGPCHRKVARSWSASPPELATAPCECGIATLRQGLHPRPNGDDLDPSAGQQAPLDDRRDRDGAVASDARVLPACLDHNDHRSTERPRRGERQWAGSHSGRLGPPAATTCANGWRLFPVTRTVTVCPARSKRPVAWNPSKRVSLGTG